MRLDCTQEKTVESGLQCNDGEEENPESKLNLYPHL